MLYDVHYMLYFYVRSHFEPGETNLTCVKDIRIIYRVLICQNNVLDVENEI